MDNRWSNFWKENWEQTRERITAWWTGEGMVLSVTARRDTGLQSRDETQAPFYYLMAGLDIYDHYLNPQNLVDSWVNPVKRAQAAARNLEGIYFGGEAIPFFDTHIGPGSLATFIGSTPRFAEETVWYEPVITDPDNHPPLCFDPENPWYLKQKALLEAGMEVSQGRYLVGMPDLIENLDTLASLRDSQLVMMDMVERPAFVKQRIAEINQVFFEVFDRYFEIIRDPWGGNIFSAFAIWGPGKTAKVQCDAAAMISPQMFAEFVAPALTEQCAWLDYSMYHLDGTQAVPILDTLLAIEPLNAIEWTPQISLPQGGDPMWYDLYRKILEAGKCVQAISVRPDEVIPLINAVGTKGLFILTSVESEAQAREIVAAVERYR